MAQPLKAPQVPDPLAQHPPSFDNCLVYRADTLLSGVADTFAGMCQSFSRVLTGGASDAVIGQARGVRA